MDYGEVLTSAWKIIWKFKVLWIFGILASCGGGNGGGGGNSNMNRQSNNGQPFGGPNNPMFRDVERFFQNIPVWVYVAAGVAFIFFILVMILLGTVGRIGLIRGASLADEGAEKLSFGQLFQESLPYFWRVFLFDFIFGLLIVLLILLLTLPVILAIASSKNNLAAFMVPLICVALCLLLPVSFLLQIFMTQTRSAMVIENLGLVAGMRRGLKITTSRIGPLILMTLILGIGSGIIGFVLALPLILPMIPIIVRMSSGQQPFLSAGVAISLGLFCIGILFYTAASGVLQAYVGSAWTLTFRRLALPAKTEITPEPPAELPAEPAVL